MDEDEKEAWLKQRRLWSEIENSCRRKVRHETLEAATKAMRVHRKKYHASKVPYECRHCGGWHIGGQKRDG